MSKSPHLAQNTVPGDDQFARTIEALIGVLPDAAAIVDADRNIVHANARLIHMLGFCNADLVGNAIDRFIANFSATDILEHGPDHHEYSETSVATPVMAIRFDGETIPVEFIANPVQLDDRRVKLCVIRDVRRLQQQTETFSKLRQRFNESQVIAKIGSYEHDLVTGNQWWSDSLYSILQIPRDSDADLFELYVSRLHPDDRAMVLALRDSNEFDDVPQQLELRAVMPDGSQKTLLTHACAARDAFDRKARIFGTIQDITEFKNLELRYQETEQRYLDAQRISHFGNWEWDAKTDISWWSAELYRILDEDPETSAPNFDNFLNRVHPDDRDRFLESRDTDLALARSEKSLSVRMVTATGEIKHVDVIIEAAVNAAGEVEKVTGTIQDVTMRHELEQQLDESETRYASTVELAALGIAHVDTHGHILWANQYLLDLLGYSMSDLRSQTIQSLSHPDDVHVTDLDRKRLHRGEIRSLSAEKRYVTRDGQYRWVRITSALKRDEYGAPQYDISIIEDISERKAAEQQVQYLATHDGMTGLRNRATFIELLTHAIENAKRHDSSCALLFIDLDRFKIVNDSLGHGAGDQLVVEMAARLQRCTRESDVIARLGGDEFVVLLEEIESDNTPEWVAKKILSSLMQPVEIDGRECRVTASIGISKFPEDGTDPATLMKHADMAMYQAKDEGKNNFQYFSPDRSPMSVERLVLETHLANALKRNEFTILYQPKVEIATGRISGVEALLRWWNPELGTVSPAQFIPVAEDTGLIVAIGKWVLREACKQCVQWQKEGLPPITIAVNLSPRQFRDAALLSDIRHVLDTTGLDPQLLELEVTESMIMHNVEHAAEQLNEIRKLGIKLAIDDFGTGYSSLSQLKRFPIDTLKIDRSFVRDIPDNPEDRAIAEAIISLGRTLGVSVIAEGVETPAQHEFLETRACDLMQGYLFSKPGTPDALANLLKRNLLGRSRKFAADSDVPLD